LQLVHGKVGRRAAAEEKGVDTLRRFEPLHLAAQRLHVRCSSLVAAHRDREVAVAAVVGTERQMDVRRSRIKPGLGHVFNVARRSAS
jgi:hypothetical protein